jgi:protein gp37
LSKRQVRGQRLDERKYRNGILISGGIEWTDATWNVIRGCPQKCKWVMPNGKIAKCYAETCAEGVASRAYPNGFEFHYWHPERLEEPLKEKEPLKIFHGFNERLWRPLDTARTETASH